MESFKYDVPDLASGLLLIDALAEYDLFQFKHHVKPDFSNMGGVETYDPLDGWCDVEDDDE